MTVVERPAPALGFDFQLPAGLEAGVPPEYRGLGRHQVRMMVTQGGRIEHRRFPDIVDELEPGDVLVINTSATLPAALEVASPEAGALRLHVSTRVPVGDLRLVELRRAAGPASRPGPAGGEGWKLELAGGATAELLARAEEGSRLWVARIAHPPVAGGLEGYLARHGFPIRYPYVAGPWPLSAYQTVYANEPGSSEMPSAGRAFTHRILTSLVARGVEVAPLVLHTGVSSLEDHEPPYAEWFRLPASTARRIDAARRSGGRVVAVGTTVVRALESVADESGTVHPAEGWTSLVLGPERPVRVVDGLLTGWHPPQSSHLALLSAVGGGPAVEASYAAALERRYLWHEFGDLQLLLRPYARDRD